MQALKCVHMSSTCIFPSVLCFGDDTFQTYINKTSIGIWFLTDGTSINDLAYDLTELINELSDNGEHIMYGVELVSNL